jgi:hypothetical protein
VLSAEPRIETKEMMADIEVSPPPLLDELADLRETQARRALATTPF